jgi:hypothetical protein
MIRDGAGMAEPPTGPCTHHPPKEGSIKREEDERERERKKIGEKIADKRSPEGVRVCTILGVCTSSVGTLGGLNDWFTSEL